LVLAAQTQEDEKTGLRTLSTWLWGQTTQRHALVLNFAFRNQPLDTSLIPGLVMEGELVFFPGTAPLRAVFRQKQPGAPAFMPCGYPSTARFLEAYAACLGKNPWLESFPANLENVIPLQLGQKWFLTDSQQQALPLSPAFSRPWEFFALSGGHALTVFGLWDGFYFTPLTAWSGEQAANL
jgi:hypothetical protein